MTNRILIEEEQITVRIKLFSFVSNTVGKKGSLILDAEISDPSVFPQNYEKDILFEMSIIENYKVKCGVWRGYKCQYILCNFDESIPAGEYELDFEHESFVYKNYLILFQNKKFSFKKIDSNLVDLYSNRKVFTIDKNEKEDKTTYDLKFNISSYNNERIYLSYYTVLDNCKKENNQLVCPMKRNQLINIAEPSENNDLIGRIKVQFLNNNNKLINFELIPPIEIFYKMPKEDIFVRITKIAEKVGGDISFIAYETNVTDITNVRPDTSDFQLPFVKENGEESKSSCTFRKYDKTPLYLLCRINCGTYRLKEIKEEKNIYYINIKYNFRIQPTNNKELVYINCEKLGFYMYWVYPEILDFSKNDSLTVEYYTYSPEYVTGLTFNEKAEDLACEITGYVIKCVVPKSHFKGKKNGYYFTKHRNQFEGKSISYEIPPIKVILPDSGSKSFRNYISFTFIYSFILFFLTLF